MHTFIFGENMPLYEYICDSCNNKESFFCSFENLPEKVVCKCESEMRRDYGIGGFIIHNKQSKSGLYHATVKMGNSPTRNTTKGFTESVRDLNDNKMHSYPRYYMKNNPEVDHREIARKADKMMGVKERKRSIPKPEPLTTKTKVE